MLPICIMVFNNYYKSLVNLTGIFSFIWSFYLFPIHQIWCCKRHLLYTKANALTLLLFKGVWAAGCCCTCALSASRLTASPSLSPRLVHLWYFPFLESLTSEYLLFLLPALDIFSPAGRRTISPFHCLFMSFVLVTLESEVSYLLFFLLNFMIIL